MFLNVISGIIAVFGYFEYVQILRRCCFVVCFVFFTFSVKLFELVLFIEFSDGTHGTVTSSSKLFRMYLTYICCFVVVVAVALCRC